MTGLTLHRHLATIGLVAGSAALFAAGFGFLASDAKIETAAVEAREPALPIIPDTQQPSSAGAEAFRRPLFQRDRTAIDEPSDVATSPSGAIASSGDMRLKGILINGVRARASLQLADGDTPVWLSVGEEAGAWTIDAITPESVRLSSGDEVVELRLYEDR